MTLTDSEVEYIKGILKRDMNSLEEGMLDVMFSEHCSYKSSRPILRLFPTEGENIILGPGDDAGLVSVTDKYALAVGMESHNHPSAIEPYGGAGTGIGGILRDIISMGAMPIALLDSLRFGPLEDEKFISLEKVKNDCHVWCNLSLLSDDNSDFAKFLLGRSYDSVSRDGYKDAILTAKINFNKGNADIVVDSYTPNYPYDTSLLKKQLADNIYSFVNGENNYGFFSLAFNSKELANYLRNVIGDISNFPIKKELAELEEYGIDVYKFIELLGGDIFMSVWDMPSSEVDQTPAILVSASITDSDTVKIILEALAKDSSNDIYTIEGYFCFIKDSILYMSNNEEVVNSIVNGELPSKSLSNDKLNIAKKNEMALYLEFSPNLDLYGIDEYSESLESVYFTSNILENNHSQMILKINTRDKQKNSLTVIKSFLNLE